MLMSHESPKQLSEGLQSRIVGLHIAVKVYKIEVFGKEKGHYIQHGKGTRHHHKVFQTLKYAGEYVII